MDSRLAGGLIVFACLMVAIPWRFVIGSTDLAFVLFALAPPLLLASGIGLRDWSRQDHHRS